MNVDNIIAKWSCLFAEFLRWIMAITIASVCINECVRMLVYYIYMFSGIKVLSLEINWFNVWSPMTCAV